MAARVGWASATLPRVQTEKLPILTRLWFAWVCLARVLFDGAFARRVWLACVAEPAAPPPPPRLKEPDATPALQLLGLLQREGRFIDFVEQDVTAFSDAEVGAAARVVHEGCRRALTSHSKIVPVRTEEEGSAVVLADAFDPAQVKLSGDVRGALPYRGHLRHRGWRVTELLLPTAVDGHDPRILAPAEVEL
jgi:hypothetical protein